MPNEKYDHQAIEKKWQERWAKDGAFRTTKTDNGVYVLDMFPYPSGDGLHVGHPEGYTATDIYSRYLRMTGKNVLHPMGWDAFGLPAENYAIKMGIHPAEVTAKNIANFKRQIQSLGFSYDWDREVNTTDPAYYKWTQWIFLQLFKRGLAYEKEAPIWWCPKDKTGLANEEVVNGKCDRCGTEVEKKMLKQWMLKITSYADRLLEGLDRVDWPEGIKTLQRNWIGKSEGAEVKFQIPNSKSQIKFKSQASNLEVWVFTTRPDTLFGATYLVLSPEHELVKQITTDKQKKAVEKYVKSVAAKSDLERTSLEKEKTGVFTGAYAENPMNKAQIPIWIADYVLSSYGTGAIMAVPAHDERDYAFAKKFGLPIKRVVEPKYVAPAGGSNEIKHGQPFVRREAICAVVRNPKDDTYLCISWKTVLMHGLVTGGLEGDEDIVEAARREIREETGHKNVRLVHDPQFAVQTQFHHLVKKGNRWARFQYLFFELVDEEKDLVDEKEVSLHEVVWKKADELGDYFTVFEAQFINNFLKNPEYVHTGEGILHNSGEFSDLDSTEARTKIVTWLEKQSKAHPKTQYKLRDWVFSRQRYWGEPIPLVHCEHCKQQVESTPHVLNFFNHDDSWKRLLSGEKTVETRALNPDEPDKYFGNIKEGDYIKGVQRDSGEVAYFRVKKVTKLKNLEDLLKHPDLVMKMKKREKLPTLAELKKGYSYTSDYVDRIEKHGLVAWEVKHVLPGIILDKPEDLPVLLPEIKKYEPTGTGESPLAGIKEWVNVKCRICGHDAKRETNTMPQWAGSCWYYLRYCDPKNNKEFASAEAMKAWLPVDMYVGGAEHAVLHLLYARFWHKVLFDAGFIPKEVGDEPFKKLKNQGLILGPDGEKMSKSRGNVINPDEIVEKYGADTLRMYEMFMGPFEDAKPWDTNGILGVRRFLDKAWKAGSSLDGKLVSSLAVGDESRMHRYTKLISEGIEDFRFNTCVSSFMKWTNEWSGGAVSKEEFEGFLKLLSPLAPHITEELWLLLGHKNLLAQESWPKFNPKKIVEASVTIAVQVQGKLRGTLTMLTGSSQAEVEIIAKAEPNVAKYLTSEPKKTVFVEDKLINFVI